MLKKTIKYVDYNGDEREEDFYFNLKKSELLDLEMEASGNLEETIKRIIDERDSKKIMGFFKELVHKAYGKKDIDGRRFRKSPEILEDFMETEAYSELIMELASDADKAAAFIKGILPTDPDEAKKPVPAPGNVVAIDAHK